MSSYRLLSFDKDGITAPGILVEGSVFDLRSEIALHAPTMDNYRTIDELLVDWEDVKPLLDRISNSPGSRATSLEQVLLRQPIQNPGAIYCAAANYFDHAEEMGNPITKEDVAPYFFIKSSSVIVGTGEAIRLPMHHSEKFDWEIEIGVVIGKEAENVSENEAMDYVAGYTIVNDLSARDHVRREDWPFGTDWFEHKSFETSAPMGPWITPASEISDVQSLKCQTWINGDLKQNSSSKEMVFTVVEQVAHISRQMTLRPGDVIATGTCAGVGFFLGEFLSPGDEIKMEVEGLGVLTNPVTVR